MCMKKEENCFYCPVITILGTLLSAAGIAAIFYAGLIASITTLLYVTLILGVLGLLFVLFKIFCSGKFECQCIKESCLIPTSVGAIITSIFALTATTLATASIATSILIGAVSFFLVSVIIGIINYITCIFCDKKCCME